MNRKYLPLSGILVALNILIVMASFITSNLGHSHAKGSIPPKHQTSTISGKPSHLLHAASVVQNNVYYNSDGNVIYALNATTGSLLWRSPIGRSSGNCETLNSLGSATLLGVINGVVYASAAEFSSTCIVHFYALQASNGSPLWPSPVDFTADFVTLPQVVNGVIVLNVSKYLGEGVFATTLFALKTHDGSQLWSATNVTWYGVVQGLAYANVQQTDGSWAACELNIVNGSSLWCDLNTTIVAVIQGIVYVAGGGSIFALKGSDGSQIWSYSGVGNVVANSGGIYFVGTQGVCALNISDGSVRWCSPGSVGFGIFSVVDGVVYTAGNGNIVEAFKTIDGTLLWSKQLGSFIAATQGIAYFWSRDHYYIKAIRSTDGKVLWSYQTPYYAFYDGVTLSAGFIYFADSTIYLLDALNATTGTLIWQQFIGSGSLSSSPPLTVTNGITYVGFGDAIYALSATSGILLWRYHKDSQGLTTPTTVNGTVYVGSGNHTLYALRANNGSIRWSYQVGGSIIATPTVSNGVVYFGSYDGKVYALNASDGTLLWYYQTGDVIDGSPKVARGVLYVGSVDGYLYALTIQNGTLLWRSQMGYPLYVSPSLMNGTLYITLNEQSTGVLYALAASTGKQLWARNAVYFISSQVAVKGVIYTAGDYVYAFKASDGSQLWNHSIDGFGDLTVTNGVIYMSSIDPVGHYPSVSALDASNGKLLHSYSTGLPTTSSTPSVVNDVIFIGSADDYNHIYYVDTIDTISGNVLWTFKITNTQSSSAAVPFVKNNVVYISLGDGSVFALNATNGQQLWKSVSLV